MSNPLTTTLETYMYTYLLPILIIMYTPEYKEYYNIAVYDEKETAIYL